MSDEDTAPPISLSLMFSRLTNRVTTNLSNTFANSSKTDYIRLVAILGGYLLLRPYLQKLGAKYQERDHARAVDENEESSMAATGVKARVVAGEGDEDEVEESSDDEEVVSWGKKQRVQQRKERIRKKREIEEKLAKEDDDDKDIQEFLHD
ncbi:hypothetical protein ABW19_dt0208787 [Dactylella cylindrospora]|nr:hypothetical protein ABW19_dt0208787 [Dactylella cylindrospora]